MWRWKITSYTKIIDGFWNNYLMAMKNEHIESLIDEIELKQAEKRETKVFVEDMLADFDADQQQWEALQGESNTRKMKSTIQQSILYWRIMLGNALTRSFYTWMHIAVFRSMQNLEVNTVMDLREKIQVLQMAVDGDAETLGEEIEKMKSELNRNKTFG